MDKRDVAEPSTLPGLRGVGPLGDTGISGMSSVELQKTLREVRAHLKNNTREGHRLRARLHRKIQEEWLASGGRTFSFEEGLYAAFVQTDIPPDLEDGDIRLPFGMVRFVFEGGAEMYVSQGDGEGITIYDVQGVDYGLGFVCASECDQPTIPLRCRWEAIINAVLFLSSKQAEQVTTSTSHAVEALRAKLERLKGQERRDTKRQIRELPERDIVVRAPSMSLPTVHEGGGTKLTKRHMVRGFWRSQPYGRRRELRKRIWISPHPRGPEHGELVLRNYRVDKE